MIEFRVCQNDDCLAEFEPRAHNAIYCSDECRKIVTNKRILQKYHDDKERMATKRVCVNEHCTTILSRYNNEDICEPCKTERFIQRLIGWGWDEEELREEWRD